MKNPWNKKENHPYYTFSDRMLELYGAKVYKIALNANLTCPNRDGSLDTRGCVFCSKGGSGEFASDHFLSIYEQIEQGKRLLSKKVEGVKYIAYFQAFTNTYGDIEYLKKIYFEALSHPDIVGISIATRPDCLGEEVLDLLEAIGERTHLWIELGLQTIHEKTSAWIRRGYSLPCFEDAIRKLSKMKAEIVVHLILGFPGEGNKELMDTIDYISGIPIHGVKLQLLHILKGTDLSDLYQAEPFPIPTLPEYANMIVDCIEKIPSHIVIHRITGDGPRNLLIAPKWSLDKKKVFNTIFHCFKERKTYQGKASPH